MKLSSLMKSKGYSFQDLAEASGVAKATIARIVYGQAKEPHPSTKRKIASVFNVEISEIDEFFAELNEAEDSPKMSGRKLLNSAAA
jgi:transcriptional regulator with XRE-family HTH domain